MIEVCVVWGNDFFRAHAARDVWDAYEWLDAYRHHADAKVRIWYRPV